MQEVCRLRQLLVQCAHMKIELLHEDKLPEAFDCAVHHPMQLFAWGALREDEGTHVVRVIGKEGNKVVESIQMTIHPIPVIKKAVGYVPRSTMPSKEMLDFLAIWGKKHGLTHITFEPNVKKESLPILEKYDTRIAHSQQSLFTPWQFLLDLTKSEEELSAQMKSKTRYNAKLAAKKGVTVAEESDAKGLEDFIALYTDTCKRQSYNGRSPKFLKSVWKHMEGKAHIVTARFEGEALASYMLFLHNGVLYYPYGGSSTKHRNFMAANMLMWEAVKFGKHKGATLFDMWGALGPNYDKKNPWSGFTRFKQGYGGDHVEFSHSFDLVIAPVWRKLYGILYAARKWYWGLRR